MKNYKTNLFAIHTILFLLLSSMAHATVPLDLEDIAQDFVFESKKITVPGYPEAFNPSIIRWQGSLLMSFRVLINPHNLWQSKIGLVWLNEDFSISSDPYFLDTRVKNPNIPYRSEDARLFTIGNSLYVIYNDSIALRDEDDRRMFISEITYDGVSFQVVNTESMTKFEGEDKNVMEKNWIPFDYNGKALLAYSLEPHKIFKHMGRGRCKTLASTPSLLSWDLGKLRGGTPALLINENEYLAFFHSAKQVVTTKTNDEAMWHYFIGAYKFESNPPFAITHLSPEPIIGKEFYDDSIVFKKVIFPGSFIYDDKFIWIAYGRDDCECWIVKLDKELLLNSLIPVSSLLISNATR